MNFNQFKTWFTDELEKLSAFRDHKQSEKELFYSRNDALEALVSYIDVVGLVHYLSLQDENLMNRVMRELDDPTAKQYLIDVSEYFKRHPYLIEKGLKFWQRKQNNTGKSTVVLPALIRAEEKLLTSFGA